MRDENDSPRVTYRGEAPPPERRLRLEATLLRFSQRHHELLDVTASWSDTLGVWRIERARREDIEQDATQTRTGPVSRRSPRVPRRVSLHVDALDGTIYPATATVINRHGALVLSPKSFPAGSRIIVTNVGSGVSLPCRVVWCGEQAGNNKLGIELLAASVDFWGSDYRRDEATA